jgi:FkbM family methyltransferase
MIIPFDTLIRKYGINLQGILHVGAHLCEEIAFYEKYIPRNKILWVEAIAEKVEQSKNIYPGILIENAIISDTVKKVKFNVSNNGQSSSLLDLGIHKYHHPEVSYVGYIEGETQLLINIINKYNTTKYNFLNLDIQGSELSALKSMETYLENVDYIYTEVNCDYVYEKCALIGEIDDYLKQFNFIRVETEWHGNCKWGDAFYIRK